MPKKKTIVKEEGLIEVTKTVLGKETSTEQKIKIRPFATIPMTIGIKLGQTINTGDFESVRIDVSIFVPCYVEEAKEMYSKVIKFAGSILNKEVRDLRTELQKE